MDGLITAYALALERGEPHAQFLPARTGENGWLFPTQEVKADDTVTKALCARLKCSGGEDALRTMFYVFLADVDRFESPLYEVVRLTIEKRRNILNWHSHESVRTVVSLARSVGRETHRFTGLLRFRALCDGTLYADYRPDHNITLLLTGHFRERLSAERWVIHDRRRDLAVAWNEGRLWPVTQVPDDVEFVLAADERAWQGLWRCFTRTISIAERRNPRLQRQLMPARYWPYLTEMQAPSA